MKSDREERIGYERRGEREREREREKPGLHKHAYRQMGTKIAYEE